MNKQRMLLNWIFLTFVATLCAKFITCGRTYSGLTKFSED